MTQYHLAQLNIGRIRGPIDGPIMKEFVDNLERINKVGDESPGFVWRMQTDSGNATEITYSDDEMMKANMTVWENIEALFEYTYRSEHVEFLRRRAEWFEKMDT